jgi:hypothetical protein
MIDAFTLTKKNDETNNNSISFIDRSSYSNNNDDSNAQNFNSSNAGQNNPNVRFCNYIRFSKLNILNSCFFLVSSLTLSLI